MTRQKREIRYGGAMMGQAEIDAVTAVMRREHGLVVGEHVARFEQRVAALMGKRYGAMVNSGSSALMVALRLLDLKPGDEVITPALTFSSDIAAIVHTGGVPVLADVEPDTYQIDPGRIEPLITAKTRALLVPDLIGGMPDWDLLRDIADRHKLILVEDSADTLGGTFRGQPSGARADIGITSFSIFHIMTCLGNGGMVCVDDEAEWDRSLMLRAWGRSSEKYLFGSLQQDSDGRFFEDLDGLPYDGMFIFEELAYGFIPNEAGAAFGLAQLDQLAHFAELRDRNFQAHQKFLQQYDDLFLRPRILDDVVTTWICYPLQLRAEVGWDRRELQVHLEDAGIFTRVIFSGNIARQPMMRGVDFRADPQGLPGADQVMEHGLMLPCHPTMDEDDCGYLYEVLEEFIAARRS